VGAALSSDVLVVGGGPAGSATAIAAARAGLSVMLVESLEPPFRKVCGEFLSDPGMEIYRRLTGDLSDRYPRIRTVAFRSEGSRASSRRLRALRPLRLEPSAWGVRRETLDGTLLGTAAGEGVRVRTGTRVEEAVFERGSWRVTLESRHLHAGRETVVARKLVRAGGRRALAGSNSTGWLGRKAYAATGPSHADIEISFTRGGYFGLSPVEDGAFSLCGLSRGVEPPWEGARPAPGDIVPVKGTPRFRLGYQEAVDPSSFSVGDALAAWPPLVGDGITMALISGSRLGERLADPAFDPEAWKRLWSGLFGGGLCRSLRLHALLQNEIVRATLIGAADVSPSFGEWLLSQPRFVPVRQVRLEG
jgi:flavin-dependent dehydrogenase